MTSTAGADAGDRLGAVPEAQQARAAAPKLALGEISPFVQFTNASLATAGVGLRNRLVASINEPCNLTSGLKGAYLLLGRHHQRCRSGGGSQPKDRPTFGADRRSYRAYRNAGRFRAVALIHIFAGFS